MQKGLLLCKHRAKEVNGCVPMVRGRGAGEGRTMRRWWAVSVRKQPETLFCLPQLLWFFGVTSEQPRGGQRGR